MALLVGLTSLGFALTASGDPPGEPRDRFASLDSEVHVRGMTFVASRDSVDEFVVHAARGVFVPGTRLVHLEQVHVVAAEGFEGKDFAVRCDRGELDVETSDFFAEGNVEGHIADGRNYSAPWVRYDHEKALLFTDASVAVNDSTGRFRGDGFRYDIRTRRFRLLGNVSLEPTP